MLPAFSSPLSRLTNAVLPRPIALSRFPNLMPEILERKPLSVLSQRLYWC